MIQNLLRTPSAEVRFLEVLRIMFLTIAFGGFIFYGLDHWVIGHFELDHWSAKIPLWISVVGAPLSLLLLFYHRRWFLWIYSGWMVLSILTGFVGAVLHMGFNAAEAEVPLLSIEGFLESFRGERPVLAALAHTHVGFVGLIVALTFEELGVTWAEGR